MNMTIVWTIIFIIIGCMSNFAAITTGSYGWVLFWEWMSIICYAICFTILMSEGKGGDVS